MRIRALDGNWDWQWGKGKQNYASESLATAYDVKQKLLCWFNDCFFDMQAGIDYKNLLGSKNGKSDLDKTIRKILAVHPDIVDITYFESYIQNREYHLTTRFKTVYNETIEVKI